MSPPYSVRIVAIAVASLFLLPGLASATEVRFDLSSPASSPFPSDSFTVDDHDQNTGVRVKLPKPDCAVRPSDCADMDVINTLDGFTIHAHVVAAGVFTTLSATAVLEKIRREIKASHPGPATMLGTFPLSSLTAIQWARQTGTATFTTSFLPIPALNVFPGAVGAIAFGRFASPDWETAEKFIPPIATRTGVPAVQGTNQLHFNLFLPAGPAPAGGWPVAIFGHGFTDNRHGAPFAVASTFPPHGLATIAINVVGHGGGALGTLTIIPTVGPPVTIPDGGRGIDQDGNGTIDSTEGVNATPPRGIIGNRDGLRQTVADLMQLVRVIQTGGIPGLSATR